MISRAARGGRFAPPSHALDVHSERPPGGFLHDMGIDSTAGARCPFCGLEQAHGRARCRRCGTLMGDAAEDLEREGRRRSDAARRRKAVADLFFLGGLLAGGPLLSFGVRPRIGLFLILAGGVASVLRRYTPWSTPGTVLVGGLAAALAASVFADPPAPEASEDAGRAGRVAYVERLARRMLDDGIHVEARGPGRSVVWFYVPAAGPARCGDVPEAPVREHLGELGVRRVVVAGRSGGEGVCTFVP